ncbi:hypothetical protein NSU_3665 [Novosphingobium pentaromativorans US6-1]|uniref:Uncharacterized protein n=1 Tax=Novosphingobium pentaromativorans US6-1 TaxID=1088721 RepID=G6EH43_9SPHN|nr:hypothetical protein NSU_3665 [Novosphingobium pentaromativorans US6-1]
MARHVSLLLGFVSKPRQGRYQSCAAAPANLFQSFHGKRAAWDHEEAPSARADGAGGRSGERGVVMEIRRSGPKQSLARHL